MDAQTFLNNFSTIAEAPGGVDRLRELILDLAVRGQLTRQDPEDGSVGEQLSAIAGVVQPSTLVSLITQRTIPWEIPETWRWVRFKQIVDFAPGKTPSTKDSSFWEEPELGELWASISDMPDSGTLFTTVRAISQKGVTSVMRRPPAPVGALLMSFKLTIGKVCRVGRPTYFNEAIIEIDTPREVTKEFLFRTLPLLSLGGSSKAAIKGNTLNKSSITNIPIPFPPLGEQERIVAKVDELMQLCDDLEARQRACHLGTNRLRASSLDALTNAGSDGDLHTAWSRIESNWGVLTDHRDCIDALRQAILQLAVRGRLVDQHSTEGSAEAILLDIAAQREPALASVLTKKQRPLADSQQPYPLPPTWRWTRLGALLTDLSYGTAKKCTSEPSSGSPVLRIPNISTETGEIDLGDLKYTELSATELEKLAVATGDLLIIRSNGSGRLVGRSVVVPEAASGMAFAGYLMRAKLCGVDPHYIRIALESPAIRTQIEGPIRTTSGVKNVNSSEITSLRIPLPPLEEQRRIVQRVNQLDCRCADLERALLRRTGAARRVAAGIAQIGSNRA